MDSGAHGTARESYFAVIRGPLGIGKTTVAERLAARVGGEYLSIDRILDEPGMEEWEDGYVSLRSFLRVNEIAAGPARVSLAAGTPVILDGNFYYVAQIRDLIDRLPYLNFVFTLQAPLEVCLDRDRHRARPLGEEGVRDVYAKSTSFEWGIGVDATHPLDRVVDQIRARLP